MYIKTLSQITPLDGNVHLSSYLGISQYSPEGGGKYASRKIPYGQLFAQLSAEIDKTVMQDKYHAVNGSTPVNITSLRTELNTVKSGTITFSGVKTFSSVPKITATVDTNNVNNVPNVKLVQELIDDKAGVMSENQYLPLDPGNGTMGYTQYDELADTPRQLYWHIDHGQRDSSLWKGEGGTPAGPVTCNRTGNLVCYGWLADNGNVKPGCAWVGLFGHVMCGSPARQSWVALQIQPWILGKYSSSAAQYVSFNIPVKTGLKLKIMTGFNVNGNNTALHDDKPSLMFSDSGNMPNTFVGYILGSNS